MITKAKRGLYENPFDDDLLPDEQILWMGQPDARRIFKSFDLIAVPISLLWCLVIFPMVFTTLARGELIALACPHFWIGVYVLFGRFVYDFWKKRHTYYAVTDRRLLILHTDWGRKLDALYINVLPDLNKSIGFGGVGTLTFGQHKNHWNRRNGAWTFDYQGTGFYDIHDANEVYALINELRDEYLRPALHPIEVYEEDVWGRKHKRRK